MAKRPGQTRVLIYSHDSFGLGHLRRCRAIAHELAKQNRDMSVLILSGSPIIGSFDFRNRVDFVRVPGRDQAAQWRVHLAEPEHRHRRDHGHAGLDHRAHGGYLRSGPVPGRQGASGPARRGAWHAGDPQAPRHAAGARPARRDGRALAAGPGMGAQERPAGPGGSLRLHLDLWPAADLRPVGGHRPAAQRARQDGLYRLSETRGDAEGPAGVRHCRPALFPGHAGWRRRWREDGRLGHPRLRDRCRDPPPIA